MTSSIQTRVVSLREGANSFLAALSRQKQESSQQEVYNFVRWFGRERAFSSMNAPEIANYAERLSASDTDYQKKLELLRAFLAYAKKAGWAQTNLGTHLKTKKKPAVSPSQNGNPEVITLTQQGYDDLEGELATLKKRREQVIADITRAAADKDFRENAPLHAAREQKGFLDGRIREIEEILKRASIIDAEQKQTQKTSISDTVVLCDMVSGEECSYCIVHPTEVDPIQGRISSESPIGKAVIGRGEGDVVEVKVPAGKLRYQIKKVER